MTCESCRDTIPATRAAIIEAWALPVLCLECRESFDAHGGVPLVDVAGDYSESRSALVEVLGGAR